MTVMMIQKESNLSHFEEWIRNVSMISAVVYISRLQPNIAPAKVPTSPHFTHGITKKMSINGAKYIPTPTHGFDLFRLTMLQFSCIFFFGIYCYYTHLTLAIFLGQTTGRVEEPWGYTGRNNQTQQVGKSWTRNLCLMKTRNKSFDWWIYICNGE